LFYRYKYRARASHARERNISSLSACDIGVCGELIPTSTGLEADQYWLLFSLRKGCCSA